MRIMNKICLLHTGGTIGMKRGGNGSLKPFFTGEELVKCIPGLADVACIEVKSLMNIDSANMQPENWIAIAEKIFENIDKYDGFVVTHGTDTMAYTASVLSFMLHNLGKPVVLTGAQKPLDDPATDAKQNLYNSVIAAGMDIGEVCILFQDKLIRGNRAKKISEFHLDAFESYNVEPIGKIGIEIKLAEHRRRRRDSNPQFIPKIEKRVALIELYPGIEPEVIDRTVKNGYRGIVINAFGAGNIPNIDKYSLVPSICRAIEKNVPVVISTQCFVGAVELYLYEGGSAALKAGAISAQDMTLEAATTKLMWVLGQTSDMEKIREMMQTNYAGELTLPSSMYIKSKQPASL